MRRFLASAVRGFVPGLAVLLVLFFVVPIPLRYWRFLALMLINPAACFVLYFVFGRRPSPNWLSPIWSGILFLPSIFVYYRLTALGWAMLYVVIGYIAMGIGYAARVPRTRQK